MRRKSLHALLVASALFLAFAQASVAQTAMQQRMGSQNGANAIGNLPDTAAAAAAGAGVGGGGLRLVPADFAKLKLAPGFLVRLNVLDDPDFAGTFRVDEQGNIALPGVGTLHLDGETVSEARVQIGKKLLEDGILKDPQVNLSVLEYSAPEVTIVGEVANPGKYSLLVPHKLVDVLALAGGTTPLAGNEVQITHGNSDAEPVLVHFSKATNPKSVEDAIVCPNDTVQVKRAGIVYVLGAVTKPGGYVMQEDGSLNVLQAVALANGTTMVASVGTIHLLRRNDDGTEVDIVLPFNKIQHGQSADVQLRPTDVIYVPTSKVKATLINTQSILAATASAYIYTTH